ncbi:MULTISPECIES: aldose 1-epimerase family protein [Novosphingobium]|uniref:Aldose 1-epimerase family protein n=1 Tax=Novosphingobium decolorationis TaxID=2698673 RepID=A0ABX8E8L9_9SPHN|nr:MULTISPECIES: aldose 1-epimerase family protein [Novosphingobium]MED5543711.1 aldose 1-epimerase family protein [Pseudomonadota bacterium]QVM84919.1 aldose 1-epimerase family protein [Novosphingobium decolorationis]GAM03958.1 aldose 1-epimerase [Novosphingobium sp. MBES04]
MSDSELVTIRSGDLTARINPLGAELWSLVDGEGREFMTDGNPEFWGGHAPILFPIVGGLNNGRYRLNGTEYELPRHGFARHSEFEVLIAEEERVMFSLGASDATRAVYPFEFKLNVNFRLIEKKLVIGAGVQNCGEVPMPFSIGFHPAFAWPLPGAGAKEDHKIVFSEDEPHRIRRLDPDTGLLLADRKHSPIKGNSFVPRPELFEADALIWDKLNSRVVKFGPTNGPRIAIKSPALPMLGIWQKPGADFLCIEPWQGIADPVGFEGDFREKPGVISVPAGQTRFFELHIAILDAG